MRPEYHNPLKSRLACAERYQLAVSKAIPLLDEYGLTLRDVARRFGVDKERLSAMIREERQRLGIPAPQKTAKGPRQPNGGLCFGETKSPRRRVA